MRSLDCFSRNYQWDDRLGNSKCLRLLQNINKNTQKRLKTVRFNFVQTLGNSWCFTATNQMLAWLSISLKMVGKLCDILTYPFLIQNDCVLEYSSPQFHCGYFILERRLYVPPNYVLFCFAFFSFLFGPVKEFPLGKGFMQCSSFISPCFEVFLSRKIFKLLHSFYKLRDKWKRSTPWGIRLEMELTLNMEKS
jgi:hypothetical protein